MGKSRFPPKKIITITTASCLLKLTLACFYLIPDIRKTFWRVRRSRRRRCFGCLGDLQLPVSGNPPFLPRWSVYRVSCRVPSCPRHSGHHPKARQQPTQRLRMYKVLIYFQIKTWGQCCKVDIAWVKLRYAGLEHSDWLFKIPTDQNELPLKIIFRYWSGRDVINKF